MSDWTETPRAAWIFDDGFADCTLVALHSALKSSSGGIDAYLHPIGEVSITEADLDRLRKAFPKSQITLKAIDIEMPQTAPHGRLPLSCCGRLHLPQIHQGRMIYLDGDILVRQDLRALWRHDLQGKALGACLAPGVQAKLALAQSGRWPRAKKTAEAMTRRAERLGGIDLKRYFNSGVLVLDLDRINALGLDAPMRDISAAARYPSQDQDWLNIVFQDETTLLPAMWNSGWGNPRTACDYVPKPMRDQFEQSRKDPAIIHYTGGEKPWRADKPPFRLHLLTKALERRQRQRFWAEYQTARQSTEQLLGRMLFGR